MKNKIIKLLVLNVFFLLCFYVSGFLLKDYRVIKIVIFIVILFLVSIRNIDFLKLTQDNSTKGFIFFVGCLFILFETSKFLAYKIGILPRYDDVPIIFSMLSSLVSIILYYIALFVVLKTLHSIDKNRGKK